jgi:hypothetical protein
VVGKKIQVLQDVKHPGKLKILIFEDYHLAMLEKAINYSK